MEQFVARIVHGFSQLGLDHQIGIGVIDVCLLLIGFSFQEGQRLRSMVYEGVMTIIFVLLYPIFAIGILLDPRYERMPNTCFVMYTFIVVVLFAFLVAAPGQRRT